VPTQQGHAQEPRGQAHAPNRVAHVQIHRAVPPLQSTARAPCRRARTRERPASPPPHSSTPATDDGAAGTDGACGATTQPLCAVVQPTHAIAAPRVEARGEGFAQPMEAASTRKAQQRRVGRRHVPPPPPCRARVPAQPKGAPGTCRRRPPCCRRWARRGYWLWCGRGLWRGARAAPRAQLPPDRRGRLGRWRRCGRVSSGRRILQRRQWELPRRRRSWRRWQL
jgi:hypothetical protein